MPIYEYECSSCQKVVEVMQRMTEEPLSHCPDCHGTVTKLVSMSAFHLKGGGWFADGYGSSGNSGKSSGNDNGSAAEPASKTTEKNSSSGKTVDSKANSTKKSSETAASP